MAGQWDVVSQTPTPPPTPPQASGGADPWQVVSQNPTGQPPPNPYDQDTIMGNLRATREEVKGLIKGAGRTAAGLLDVYAQSPGGMVPGVAPGTAPGARAVADWLHQHTQLNNEYQKTGNVAETIAEFAGPALLERLGLSAVSAAGEAGSAVDAAEAAPKVSESLGNLAKKAKIFEDHPDIHAAVQRGIQAIQATAPGRIAAKMVMGLPEAATRGATEQGAQTFVKSGGDIPATGKAALTGALWSAGLHGAFGGGAQTLREGAQAVENARPTTLNIGGGDFPALAGGKKLNMPPLDEVGVDPVTSAVDQASGNIGKTGVANSLARSIQERAPETTVIPPSRRLPGGGGVSIPGPGEPTPTGKGQIAFEPGKQHIGTIVKGGKGPGQFDLGKYDPDLAAAAAERGELPPPQDTTGPGSHRESVYQYRNAPKPGTEGNVQTDTPIGGPGNLVLGRGGSTSGPADIITADGQGMSIMRARQQLAQWDRILNDDGIVDEMGVREHGQLVGARQDLADQLRRYDNYAANQNHFPVPDIQGAVDSTTSLGEAGEMLKATHQPVFQAADDISSKEWSNLRDEEKRLEKQIYGENPTGKLDDLRQQLAENQQKQMDFFDQHRTQLSPQEMASAKAGYQDGIVLKNLHNLIESNFNGITRAEVKARPSLQRIFQPGENFNNQLEDFYNDGFRNTETNRQVLERTIGQEHMLDLKQIGQLFENSERRAATKGLLQTIQQNVRLHRWGIGGVVGGGLGWGAARALGEGGAGMAEAIGAGAGVGAAGAGTISGTLRFITDRIATDPDFMKRFTYAVLNKIPPRTAGPILAARIGASLQNQPLQTPRGAQ